MWRRSVRRGARRPRNVTALDREPALIAARGAPGTARYVLGSLDALPFSSAFDLVLARGVLNDFVQFDQRRKAMESITASLRSRGVLVADVRETKAHGGRIDREAVVVRQHEGVTFRSMRSIDADGVIHSHETFESEEGSEAFDFRMRTYTPEEITQVVKGAGLQLRSLLPGYGAQSRLTDRLVLVAHKP